MESIKGQVEEGQGEDDAEAVRLYSSNSPDKEHRFGLKIGVSLVP